MESLIQLAQNDMVWKNFDSNTKRQVKRLLGRVCKGYKTAYAVILDDEIKVGQVYETVYEALDEAKLWLINGKHTVEVRELTILRT